MRIDNSNKIPILGKIGDKIQKYLNEYSRLQNETMIYNEEKKKLDITKLVTKEDLAKILQTNTSGYTFGQSMFEKFFDLSMGRYGRYTEYENIMYRIPEVSAAIQIYVDSILAPNIGNTENQIKFDTDGNNLLSKQAKVLIQTILNRTNFYNILPQIIYTTLVYGDCFIELEPTRMGVRYIIHPTKNCSLVYDSNTDIELGLLVQIPNHDSTILKILSETYPQVIIPVDNKIVSIISDKKYLYNKNNKYQIARAENQISELIKDIYKDKGCKYRFLAPHRYARFPIYYNNMYYPYGTSILDPIRSIAKQLLLIEAALAIYRATRTPLRSLWSLEVGNIPPDQIPGIMKSVMSKFRRQKIINSENGTDSVNIDSIPEFMGVEEDIWTTTIAGQRNLTVENLPVPDITPYTNDADYFKQKLLSALGVPPSYLASEEGGSTRALLTLEDIRFSRTIRKYQTDFNNALQDFINDCFLLIDKPQYIDLVKITLPDPNTIETNLRIENLSNKLGTANDFLQLFPNIPKLWAIKNIIGITDDELEEMEKAQKYQEQSSLFIEQKPGQMNSDNEMMGSGGMGLGGGDIGDLGMDEDMDFNESNEFNGPMGNIDLNNLGSNGELSPNESLNEEINETTNV